MDTNNAKSKENTEFRKAFFRNLNDEPIDSTDPRYVPLFEGKSDVIQSIHEAIYFSFGDSSVQLLSGYRGAGKSTELRRLQKMLTEDGYHVILLDMEKYINVYMPIEVTDFLLALCGAVGDALKAEELLGKDPANESAWGRLKNYLTSEVNIPELSIPGIDLKAEIKTSPTFRQRVRGAIEANVSGFVSKVHDFFADCIVALQKRHNEPDLKFVVLVDSVEHVRGIGEEEAKVHASIERLFSQHNDKLSIPNVHLVYTVPPWIRVKHPGIGGLYKPGKLYILPEQNIYHYEDGSLSSSPNENVMARLRGFVAKRGDWMRLLGSQDALDRIIYHSGGHLRDLLRLIRAATLQAQTVPLLPDGVDFIIQTIRSEFLPIAHRDAVWLANVAKTHEVELEGHEHLGDLARFFDTHLVLCYIDGKDWYDAHPIIREHILDQAERYLQRKQNESS
jgi:hypothetical protein